MNDQEPIRQVASSKEEILASLKEHGYRLTEQRKLIVDIIANEEYTCCKEVYFLAHKRDNSIGIATVYRMINTLEEIGAISRRNMYKIVRNPNCRDESICTIELDDNTVQKLSRDNFNNVIQAGLKACGYIENQEIERMFVNSCDFK